MLKDKLILGLDVPGLGEAEEIVRELRDQVGLFKIGLELFCAAGPAAVAMVRRYGQKVFLDLKFNDIPNTVASAVRRAVAAGASMINMHASAGKAAMAAAVRAAQEEAADMGAPDPILLGVTVLTSLSGEDLAAQHIAVPVAEQVRTLAFQAREAGLTGVVCAGAEARLIKEACGQEFVTVVPGIRPAWAAANDQKRAMTPAEAVDRGADYLVVVRPILSAPNRREALARILDEMGEASHA